MRMSENTAKDTRQDTKPAAPNPTESERRPRRGQMVITMKRTENYEQWLKENPAPSHDSAEESFPWLTRKHQIDWKVMIYMQQ